MSKSREVYLLQNPTDCLNYTKGIISRNEANYLVILPEYIDSINFELLLLKEKDYIENIDILSVSNLPSVLLKKAALFGFFNNKKRADIVTLSELLSQNRTRGLTKLLLSTITELKFNFFEIAYLYDLFQNSMSDAKIQLLEAYHQYNQIIEKNNYYDEADVFKFFIEELSNPNNFNKILDENLVCIFTGFTEITSIHLTIIEAVSKNIKNCFIVMPDIFCSQTEYSKIVEETLVSTGFKLIKTPSKFLTKNKIIKFDNYNSEVNFVSKHINKKDFSIFIPKDFEFYNSLFKYYLNDTIRIQSAVRLDKSQVLTIIASLMKSRASNFAYNNFIKILHYPHFWDNHEQILSLLAYFNEKGLFPNEQDTWQEYLVLDEHKQAVQQVLGFIDFLKKVFPLEANPDVYFSALENIFENIMKNKKNSIIEKTEFSTILNLIKRVCDALKKVNSYIDINSFYEKLYIHAEENYMINPMPETVCSNLSPVRLLSSNINENVWFLGISDETVTSLLKTETVFDEFIFLQLRSQGLLKPNNKEAYIHQCKILEDAFSFANVSYCSCDGIISKLIKNVDQIEQGENFNNYLENSFSLINPPRVEIKNLEINSITATDIDILIHCPYRYFTGKILKIKENKEEDLIPTAIVEGMIMHECLEKLIINKIQEKSVDVNGLLEKILNNFEKKLIINKSALNKVMLKRVEKIITNVLNSEKIFFDSCKNLEVFKKEHELECCISLNQNDVLDINNDDRGIKFKVKIDRIDCDLLNHKLYVVDYKRTQTPTTNELQEGIKVQVPLYILVVSCLFPNYECVGGYYINLKDNKRTSRIFMSSIGAPFVDSRNLRTSIIKNEDSFYEEILELISPNVTKALKNIYQNTFNPEPINNDVCDKCYIKGACNVLC